MRFRWKLSLLFFFLSVCAGASIFSLYQQLRRELVQPAELYEVVNRQISALRVSDFPGAYRQASATFKQNCDIVQFTSMIRREYPLLARAERVEFGSVETHGRHALIQVYFIGKRNEVVPCIYTLVSEGGDWKIENVRILHRNQSRLKLNGILTLNPPNTRKDAKNKQS